MASNASSATVRQMPPQPTYPPNAAAPLPRQTPKAREPRANINKSRSFNPSVNPTVNISLHKGGGQQAAAAGMGKQGAPGGDFMSNEDIRAFSEYVRKEGRQRAVERVLDAEGLEARLRNIPDAHGSMAGARARARRVTRHLKRIAQAEKLIAKYASALYSAFEREYEAELMKIGKARTQQKPHNNFRWR